MAEKIKISDLLDPNKAEKYKDELLGFFDKGGTWKDLLGYDVNTMEAQYQTAYNLYEKGKYKKAAAAFTYLTTLNPYEYKYWLGVALSEHLQQNYGEAVVAYTIAGAVRPDLPLPHLHLGQCFHALQLQEKAVEHLKKAVSLSAQNPDHRETRTKAQDFLRELGK